MKLKNVSRARLILITTLSRFPISRNLGFLKFQVIQTKPHVPSPVNTGYFTPDISNLPKINSN